MNKMKKKWLLSLMLVLVVVLIVTGCSSDPIIEDPKLDEDATDLGEDIEDVGEYVAEELEEDVRDMNYEDIEIMPEDVFEKFMEMYPDAKVTNLELDKEIMEYEYVIEGYDTENKYELKLDPVDARILKEDQEMFDLDDDYGEISKDHLAKIDGLIEKAKMEDGSDSELDEWKISVDDGRVIMEVEIGLQTYSYDMDTESLIAD